jgi:hypothetical protein
MRIHKLIIPLLCILFFSSCRKEVVITKEVPVHYSWSLDSSLTFDHKFLLTSAALNDSVLLVANSSWIAYVNSNQLKSITGAYLNMMYPPYGDLIPPRLTNTIGIVLLDPNRLKVFSVASPNSVVSDFGSFTFTPTYTNSTNSIKGFPRPYLPNAGYPIIDSKYILVPTEIDYQAEKAYFNLLRVTQIANFPTSGNNSLSLVSSKSITLTPAPSTIGFADANYFSESFYHKFFLDYNDQFYRIDTAGNIKAFGGCPVPGVENGRVTQMVKVDNYLFAIGPAKFFISQDEGETWSLFADVLGDPILFYFNVGDELYATRGSQIWRVTLTGNAFNYQELDNNGLETNLITSINKAGKYTFVTTLSGLYYRDTATFKTAKK